MNKEHNELNPSIEGLMCSFERLDRPEESTVKLFEDLIELFGLTQARDFYPATARFFNMKSAVVGDEPRRIMKPNIEWKDKEHN